MNARSPSRGPMRRLRRESLIGLAVLAVMAVVMVASFRPGAPRDPTAVTNRDRARAERLASDRKKGEQALTIVSSLASAVDSLARVKAASAKEPEPVFDPPAATEFPSPTACMLSYLPEVELPNGALDFVCDETDFWQLDWKVRAELANRRGDGARLWNRLGPYSMAALASMRKGCCVDAPYLQAKVPALWCGILRDTLRGLGAVPSDANVRDFEAMMKCLSDRGMRLPAAFGEVEPRDAREAFGRFLKMARNRASPRGEAREGP